MQEDSAFMPWVRGSIEDSPREQFGRTASNDGCMSFD